MQATDFRDMADQMTGKVRTIIIVPVFYMADAHLV
jgi:hypothetical protein